MYKCSWNYDCYKEFGGKGGGEWLPLTISLKECIETVECGKPEVTMILTKETGQQRNWIILKITTGAYKLVHHVRPKIVRSMPTHQNEGDVYLQRWPKVLNKVTYTLAYTTCKLLNTYASSPRPISAFPCIRHMFDSHLAIWVIALTVVRRVISFLRRSTKMGMHSGSFSESESPMEATTWPMHVMALSFTSWSMSAAFRRSRAEL